MRASVLQRFGEHFRGRTLSDITVEQLNDFVVKLKKGGMSANTVLHNVIIIAQFSKRNGGLGLPNSCNCQNRSCLFPRSTRSRSWRSFSLPAIPLNWPCSRLSY